MCVKVVDSSLFARGTPGVKLGKEDKVLDLGLVNNIWGKKRHRHYMKWTGYAGSLCQEVEDQEGLKKKL